MAIPLWTLVEAIVGGIAFDPPFGTRWNGRERKELSPLKEGTMVDGKHPVALYHWRLCGSCGPSACER